MSSSRAGPGGATVWVLIALLLEREKFAFRSKHLFARPYRADAFSVKYLFGDAEGTARARAVHRGGVRCMAGPAATPRARHARARPPAQPRARSLAAGLRGADHARHGARPAAADDRPRRTRA